MAVLREEGKMTPEFRIKLLEEEMRHEVAMRALQGQRLDAHDVSISAITSTLAVIATRLDAVTVKIDELATMQHKTEKMIQDLIQAMTRDHSNGKGQ
jgi:nucleoside-triphosphatase THEP1